MSNVYNTSKFNFQKNKWLYYYLKKFVFSNKSIKNLEDVKELSIDLLDSIFRKKGFSKHKRENWLLCAQSNKCSSDCRDSNGFKTDYEKRIKSVKCIPKTRKMNPKFKNKDHVNYESHYQYAYLFLKNYNSIIYTLNEYNKHDTKNDKILESIIYTPDNNMVQSITKSYDINNQREYNELTKKIESFYPDVKRRREKSTLNLTPKTISVVDYESEFDKLAKKLREENKKGGKKNNTKKNSRKKRNNKKKTRKNLPFFFF
jgi:hypothetical protein